MDTWMKAVLSTATGGVSLYIILSRREDRQPREYAMWLLGALMGIGSDRMGYQHASGIFRKIPSISN
jgi:hypothetical protein